MNLEFEMYLRKVGFLLPIMLAAFGGVAWALINWKKSSTPALLVTIACAVLVLFTCIYPAVSVWVPPLFRPRQPFVMAPGADPFAAMRWTSYLLEVCSSSCLALCIGGLLFAVFASRAADAANAKKERDAKKNRPDDDDDMDDDGDIAPRKTRRRDEDDD